MQNKNPVVSVVIITHNQCDLFKRALRSVLNQDFYKEYEIIVVNDASTDNTDHYMKEVLSQYAYIKYRMVSNHSAILTRKNGLELAKGEYICFLDGDDYYHPKFLTMMYEAAINHHGDIVNCPVYYIKKGGKIKKSGIVQSKIYDSNYKAIKALFADYYVRGFTPTKLYKKSLLDNINFDIFKDLKVYEDIVMNYLIFKNCNILVNISTPLYYYDKSNLSVTSTSTSRIESNIKSAGLIRNDINQENDKKLYKIFKKSYFRRYLLLLIDIYFSHFETKQDKKIIVKQAKKDLKHIYKSSFENEMNGIKYDK